MGVSEVALNRAYAHATEANVDVNFVPRGLLDAGLAPASFDLVAALYPALRHTDKHDTEGVLLDLVTPGGTLLFMHHTLDHHHHDHDGEGGHEDEGSADRFDPADYVGVDDVRGRLDSDWAIDVDEERDRSITGGGGAHHVSDLVLRARRRRGAPVRARLISTNRATGGTPRSELDGGVHPADGVQRVGLDRRRPTFGGVLDRS